MGAKAGQLPSLVEAVSSVLATNNHPPAVVVVGASVVPLDATSHSNMQIIIMVQPVN